MVNEKLVQLFKDRDATIAEMVDAKLRGDMTAYRSLRAKKGNYTAKLNKHFMASIDATIFRKKLERGEL